MSDSAPPAPGPNGGGAPPPQAAAPAVGPIMVNVQYTKDLSFEVPGAPEVFAQLREQPRVDVGLDVQVQPLGGGNVFEVTLQIRCDAKAAGDLTVFIAELSYCAIVTLNVPQEAVEPVLLVEVPRLLFPFARSILADATRDGGFAPVLLTPIDFVALWQARRAQGAPPAPPGGAMLA